MEMSGEQHIPAPRATVWTALNDPEILKQSIPGCDSMTRVSDTGFEAVVTAKVGPVKATFRGKVTLSDVDAPNGYTISGEGQGGAAGFGKGGAKVQLADADGGTRLTYTVSAQVGGKLAQIGSRLIDAAARKMADDFFARFGEIVSRQAAPAGTAAPVPAAAPPPATAVRPAGLPAWVWVGGLIVIALIVLYALLRG